MQLQLKLKELELQKVATPTTQPEPPPATTSSFDVRWKVLLVPHFTEQEVDKNFFRILKT